MQFAFNPPFVVRRTLDFVGVTGSSLANIRRILKERGMNVIT